MARQFTTAIVLPGDPSAALHACTKQYVDGGLSGRAAVSHTHPASDIASGTLPAARLPLVRDIPVTLAYATTLTPDASTGTLFYCTATGNLTLQPPTNPADGQKIHLRFLSSGGAWTITLAGGFRLSTGVTSTLAMTSGRRGDLGLFYEAGDSAWTVLAATTA